MLANAKLIPGGVQRTFPIQADEFLRLPLFQKIIADALLMPGQSMIDPTKNMTTQWYTPTQ